MAVTSIILLDDEVVMTPRMLLSLTAHAVTGMTTVVVVDNDS